MSAINEFGTGSRETNDYGEPIFKGVIYAELIDFDNDGVPELLYIHGDESAPASAVCVIYRYSTESVDLLGSYHLYLNHLWISIAESKNGISYLCYSDGDSFGLYDSYYTIIDEQWTEVLSLAHHIEEIYDNDGDWLRDEFEWFVNGNNVTEQVYNDALEIDLEIANIRQINIFDDSFFTVNDVLNELENR